MRVVFDDLQHFVDELEHHESFVGEVVRFQVRFEGLNEAMLKVSGDATALAVGDDNICMLLEWHGEFGVDVDGESEGSDTAQQMRDCLVSAIEETGLGLRPGMFKLPQQ